MNFSLSFFCMKLFFKIAFKGWFTCGYCLSEQFIPSKLLFLSSVRLRAALKLWLGEQQKSVGDGRSLMTAEAESVQPALWNSGPHPQWNALKIYCGINRIPCALNPVGGRMWVSAHLRLEVPTLQNHQTKCFIANRDWETRVHLFRVVHRWKLGSIALYLMHELCVFTIQHGSN